MIVYYCDGVGCSKVEAANGLPHGWINKFDNKTRENLYFCSERCEQSIEQLRENAKLWKGNKNE